MKAREQNGIADIKAVKKQALHESATNAVAPVHPLPALSKDVKISKTPPPPPPPSKKPSNIPFINLEKGNKLKPTGYNPNLIIQRQELGRQNVASELSTTINSSAWGDVTNLLENFENDLDTIITTENGGENAKKTNVKSFSSPDSLRTVHLVNIFKYLHTSCIHFISVFNYYFGSHLKTKRKPKCPQRLLLDTTIQERKLKSKLIVLTHFSRT